jgi:hypothetical protein
MEFDQESVGRKQTTGGLLDRIKKATTNAAAATSVTGSATATAQAAQAFIKYSGIKAGSTAKVSQLQIYRCSKC